MSIICAAGAALNGNGIAAGHKNSNCLRMSTSNSTKKGAVSCANGHNGHNGHSVSILFPRDIIQQYEVGQIIGDGNFAVVHECIHKATRIEFALKIIDKRKCKGKEAMIASEVAILRRVRHPNIVQLIEDFDYKNELYLVMELVKVMFASFTPRRN